MDFQFSRSKNKNKSTVRESLINLDQDSYSIIKTYEGSGKYAFKYLDNTSSEEAEYRLIKNLRSKLNKQLKEIAKAIDIDRKLHFQMARHTCFSNLLKKGTSLDMIRQIAGHRDMKTTLNYVSGFETEDLKEELKKLKK
jgi:integrase